MTCENALEAISAALDGELSPAQRAELDAHLASCPACAALFEELAGHSRLLRELDCEVPAGLSDRILSALPEQSPAKKRTSPRWQRYGTLAACLALVIWAGIALPGQFSKAESAASDAESAVCDAVSSASVMEREARENPAAYAVPSFGSALQSASEEANGSAPEDNAPLSGGANNEDFRIPEGTDQNPDDTAPKEASTEGGISAEGPSAEEFQEEDAGDRAFYAPATRHLLL